MKLLIYKNCEWLLPLWALIIFLLCATPGHFIPSAGWMELLSLDKWIHAGIFFILNGLFWLLILKKGQNKRILFFYTLICVFYGVILEVMQAKVFTDRAYDELDMLANAFGAVLVLPLRKQIDRRLRPEKS